MKMINRLIEPTSGRIFIGDEDVTDQNPDELRRHIGYVIQGAGLFPHYSVGQNIALVPRLLGWEKERTRARVDELLDLVGLEPDQFRDRYPRAALRWSAAARRGREGARRRPARCC